MVTGNLVGALLMAIDLGFMKLICGGYWNCFSVAIDLGEINSLWLVK